VPTGEEYGDTEPAGTHYKLFHSKIINGDYSYLVYLPPDYETSTRSYPVLYLLHGSGDDQTGWGLIDPASALAELDARMAAGNQVASPVTPPTVPKPTAAKQPTAPKQPTTPKPASVSTTAR